MDQIDFTDQTKSILDYSIVHHNSRRPLRWFANWAGNRASNALMKISYMEDNYENGLRRRFNGLIWDRLWPIYMNYGTFYEVDSEYWKNTGTVDPDFDPDLEPCAICPNCDDEKHCPGCIDCDNDFIDEETGDAFRIVSKQHGV